MAELCKSAPSGKPYLPQLVPLVALVESNGRHRHMRVALSDSLAVARAQARATLRARRRAVPAAQRAQASRLLAHHADRALHLRAGQRIALFVSMAEEIDTAPLIELARSRGCALYFPRIERRTARMRFAADAPHWRVNRLGIPEPLSSRFIGARWLDVIFVPLVAFDSRGMRLGMGAGYYDRALAFRLLRRYWRGPKLIGLAYDFQRLPRIEAAPHDVPLDAVITERGYERMNRLPDGTRRRRTPPKARGAP